MIIRSDRESWDEEFRLFKENISLVLDRASTVLNVEHYFQCQPAFASCNFPYVAGSGPLPLGFLSVGWDSGILTERCPACSGKVLVTSFAGSPLSGSCAWSGLCLSCLEERRGSDTMHKPFLQRVAWVNNLRATYKQTVQGLPFEDVITELKSGLVRGGNLLSTPHTPGELYVEFSTSSGADASLEIT